MGEHKTLHQMLHKPKDEPITTKTLDHIIEQTAGTHVQSHGYSVPVTESLQKKARFARSFR
jgi:hypothetical protein